MAFVSTPKVAAGLSADAESRDETINLLHTPRDLLVAASTFNVGPAALAIVRVCLYGLHAGCAVFYTTAGAVFQAIPSTHSSRVLDFWAVTIASSNFTAVAVVYYVVAVGHVYYLAKPLAQTALALALRSVNAKLRHRIHSFLERLPEALRRRLHHRLHSSYDWLYAQLFTKRSLFGAENHGYDTIYLLRALVEMNFQSYHAHEMSRRLSNDSLNRVFVAVVVLNSLLPLMVGRAVPGKPAQHLLCRLGDLVLEILAATIVPAIIAQRYLRDLDPVTDEMPPSLWYDESWLVDTLSESSLVLFGSWFDAFIRLVFSLGLLSTLRSMHGMVVPTTHAIHPSEGAEQATGKSSTLTPRRGPTLHRLGCFLLAVNGIAVAGFHLHAAFRPRPPATCGDSPRPWFAKQPSCSLLVVDCNAIAATTGSANAFDSILDRADPASILHITFRHCPALEISPAILQCRNLVGLKTYNSSVVRWEASARLSRADHAKLRFAYFVRTNFPQQTLPPGLLSADFPPKLLDLAFSVTNLESLPDNLHEKWPPGMALSLEFSGLREFPLTLARAQLDWLALDGNKLTSLPREAFTAPQTRFLSVNGNPIATLPEDGVDAEAVTLTTLSLGSTQIRELPAWVDEAFLVGWGRRVLAGGTPLCAGGIYVLDENDPTALLVENPWLGYIDCSDASGRVGVGALAQGDQVE